VASEIDERSLDTRPDHDDAVVSPTLTGRLLSLSTHYGLLVLFAAVVIFFAVYQTTSETYLSRANIVTLFGNNAVVCVVALAALVTLTAGYIDLSVGAVTGVASLIVAGGAANFKLSLALVIPLAIAVAMALGLLNGILVARFRLSSIVTTLGMSTALGGVMLWYTKGGTVGAGLPTGLINFGSLNWLGIPRVTLVMIPIIGVCWFVLENTPFGRYLQSIASNSRSSRLVGINVDRSVLIAFTFSGFLSGVAGVLLTARSGAADATTGPSYLFLALAGVFLGATTIHPGRPNVWGTVVGIFFVAFVVSGLSLLGASSWAPDLFNGLILVAAAGLASVFARRRGGGPRML
jgi:ribose transport system permease protein